MADDPDRGASPDLADGDKTIAVIPAQAAKAQPLTGATAGAAGGEDDDERTQFAGGGPAAGAEDSDRTRFMGGVPAGGPADLVASDDGDRTTLAQKPAIATQGLTGGATSGTGVTAPRVTAAPPGPSDATIVVKNPAPEHGGVVAPGTLINNNYEIVERISAGGMGEVYRGVNPLTGDVVAIKIVLQSLAHEPKIAALFRREAKVLRELSDQAIVRYYNFLHDPGLDRFCLIMEFVDGITLLEYARTIAPLNPQQAAALLRRLAGGLEQAHKREVIHRDLSPDNVILKGGRIEDAVIIDFGIAKSTEMTEDTLFGKVAGKWKYISPEQLGSYGGEIGPRADIYSLALVIAAALRGQPLDMGGTNFEAVQRRMSIPDLTGVPEVFRPLFSHMLEPDPAKRPERMSDVIRMLDDPSQIPAEYGADRVAGALVDLLGGGESGTAGFSVPPGPLARPPGVQVGRPGGGGRTGTLSPVASIVPKTIAPIADLPEESRKGGGGKAAVRVGLVLALLGGTGYLVYSQGLVERFMATETAAADAGGTATEEVAATGEGAGETGGALTRDGFLAGFDSGACSFAARIVAGPESGQIAGFGTDTAAFAGLPAAYETAFATRPEVAEKAVAAAQCPVLDLARAVQAQEGLAPVLTLDSELMRAGGSIVGRISERRGRPVWLVLVTGSGQVHNLTEFLVEQADASATFSFGLNPSAPGEAAENLILALATDAPLVSAAAATNGTPAEQLMPLILAEIQGRDAPAGVALARFVLEP